MQLGGVKLEEAKVVDWVTVDGADWQLLPVQEDGLGNNGAAAGGNMEWVEFEQGRSWKVGVDGWAETLMAQLLMLTPLPSPSHGVHT